MTSGTSNMMSQGSPPSHAVPPPSTPASPPSKRDLKSWWKNFKYISSKHQDTHPEPRGPGIFGVPLRQSITYANVAISLVDENGQSYIYGYVPIVVAKCGVFLKEKATSIEGIFRLSGSEKRIKELKTIFDSPDRYGKGLVWDGYTVHDAANVLRRYLNDLPEPVVPLDLYEKFRDPLRGATKQAVGDAEGPQFVENFNEKAAIEKYQRLITELPPLNKQLLLYILDLLAVFAAKSDENRMNSQNLAAIFQPGMLSHPAHAMAPEEYRLNQCVIIFLIENQDHFLIGMQGTAADEKTMKEVASGTPNGPLPLTPNPNRKSGLGRTDSNASAGAESVRRDGKIRRNRSVSSRHSRADGSVTPNSPAVATTPTGGLGRSNTVPSKKSPALVGGKFKKHESPGRTPHSPALEPLTQVHPDEENPSSGEMSSPPFVTVGATHLSPGPPPPARSQERLLEVPHEAPTPTKDRNLQSLFQRSPHDGGDRRQPNKLKKKRIPGSISISAQSSCASLPQSHSSAASPGLEAANPLETIQPISQPISHPLPDILSYSVPQPIVHALPTEPQSHPEQRPQSPSVPQSSDASADLTPRNSHIPAHNSLRPEDVSRGKKSPPASLHSSFNEGSDMDQVIEDLPVPAPTDISEKDKKSRWRLSRGKKEDYAGLSGYPMMTPPHVNIGSNNNAEMSTTSIGSGSNKPRKSFTGESMEERAYNSYDGGRDSAKDDMKGPISWIRSKYREAKENVEQRRNKSPPPAHHHHHHHFSTSLLAPRGKSLDLKRDQPREDEKPIPRDAQKEASKEIPRDPQLNQGGQKEVAQTGVVVHKEPVQMTTIQRVISETEVAPTEPIPKATIPPEAAIKPETRAAAPPQPDVQQPPPQQLPYQQQPFQQQPLQQQSEQQQSEQQQSEQQQPPPPPQQQTYQLPPLSTAEGQLQEQHQPSGIPKQE